MDATFLNEQNVGPAIVELMAGDDIRCAVAFWGVGATECLLSSRWPNGARIICDISLGSTNPGELRAMGAPSNTQLKHYEKLHSKVYLSKRGAIVCSANASDNGIGFVGLPGLVEAGVLFARDSNTYGAIAAWFESIWDRANQIDSDALKRAEDAWKRRPLRAGARNLKSNSCDVPSLLAAVVSNPEHFRGIGFVFTTKTAVKVDWGEAYIGLADFDDEPKNLRKLKNWKIEDIFYPWEKQDILVWPSLFVNFHRPRQRVYCHFYERANRITLDDYRGVVFAERRMGLRKTMGFKHSRATMLANDRPLLERLFDHCKESRLYESPESLIRLIEEVDSD